jgi:hypothetical protein
MCAVRQLKPCRWCIAKPASLVHSLTGANNPTAEWTAQQLREAFPWDSAPRFLLRDRDRTFGAGFTKQVEEFGI